jgi:hypothetical protein
LRIKPKETTMCGTARQRHRHDAVRRQDSHDHSTSRADGFARTGNTAFDEYLDAEFGRLAQEREAFLEFKAKEARKAETAVFQSFMRSASAGLVEGEGVALVSRRAS